MFGFPDTRKDFQCRCVLRRQMEGGWKQDKGIPDGRGQNTGGLDAQEDPL